MNRDTLITAFTPHMHVRGKDMTYIAHYPDGTDEIAAVGAEYDFNWQLTYELAKPKLLPKGTQAGSDRALRQLDRRTSSTRIRPRTCGGAIRRGKK